MAGARAAVKPGQAEQRPDRIAQQLDRDGFAIVPDLVPAVELAPVAAAFTELLPKGAAGCRAGLGHPACRVLAASPAVGSLVGPILGPDCRAVRATLFDKSPEANWLVAWHQDLTVPVEERRDVPGFGPWSCKDGVVHVQAPAEMLGTMLAVRVHLDAASADNGALRVVPGTHRLGRIPPDRIEDLVRSGPTVTCEVPAGGVLLMRPLLLHASSRARRPVGRRVLHLEFAAGELPGGLRWHARSPVPHRGHAGVCGT